MLVPSVVAAVALVTRARPVGALGAMVAAEAVPMLLLAVVNLGGPTRDCQATPSGQVCAQSPSPYPWLVGGVLVLVTGVALILASRPRRARSRARTRTRDLTGG